MNNLIRNLFVALGTIAAGIAGVVGYSAHAQRNQSQTPAVKTSAPKSPAKALHQQGRFYDDFDDGRIDSEWTTRGNVTESGGFLNLSVNSGTTTSLASTRSHNDTSQTLIAVFDGVTLPNNTGYFAQIGNSSGTDHVRIIVYKDAFGSMGYNMRDEVSSLRDLAGAINGTYTLQVTKRNNAVAVYVNGNLIPYSGDPSRVLLPQNTCASVGAAILDSFLSGPFTAKARSVEFKSPSIQEPSASTGGHWTEYE